MPAPPSPLNAALPLPAIVVIMPVLAVHMRIRLLLESAMYTLLVLSSATLTG